MPELDEHTSKRNLQAWRGELYQKARREFQEASKTLLIGARVETVPPPNPELETWNDWTKKRGKLPELWPAYCPHCHARMYDRECWKCHRRAETAPPPQRYGREED